MAGKMNIQLSEEQQRFIETAQSHKNILVDACIGSGKTTSIQYLCNVLPKQYKILYLTYNRLLKIDAKSKIKNSNTTVTNYHGFAFTVLKKLNISVGQSDLIQRFLSEKPKLNHYDVLIIDEYQDIDLELSQMLEYIKSTNNDIQIIAVGDMEQKIYDKTTLNVREFIGSFLDDYVKLSFTKCFRLSAEYAKKLGNIWKKSIEGVNNSCTICEMTVTEVIEFLSKEKPGDILCLGSRGSSVTDVLNELEKSFPDKFNKKTVYASIRDNDSYGNVNPDSKCAIFTTYDSSKGMERKNCVVFDWTEDYWDIRLKKPQQSYEILRNIFLVAASRGKDKIIFIKNDKAMLSDETLLTKVSPNRSFENIDISKMFDFKFKENVEDCYKCLQINKIVAKGDNSEININSCDGLIDLSPCIGIYQEAVYFKNYDIDIDIEFQLKMNQFAGSISKKEQNNLSIDEKILFLTSLETKQNRYRTQVKSPFVGRQECKLIKKRLHTMLSPKENVQVKCEIPFANSINGDVLFSAMGFVDAIKNNVVYELKFVSELKHEHFLQCACYVIALKLENGILWNVKKNEIYEIKIPNKTQFLDNVARTVTKGAIDKYYLPKV